MGKEPVQWHKSAKLLPPINVPVLCKMKYVYRTEDNSPVRYLYEVHWIMEDGMWEIEERIKRIVEWSYINYNGKLIKEA